MRKKKMREDERSLHRVMYIYKNASWKKWEDFLSDKWNEWDDCACVGRILKRLRIFDEKFAISLISDPIVVKYHRFSWNHLFATIVGLIFFFKADEISRCVMAMLAKIISNQSQVNLDKTIPGLFNRARYLLFQKKKIRDCLCAPVYFHEVQLTETHFQRVRAKWIFVWILLLRSISAKSLNRH